jgi:Fasciclin domain
MRLSRSISIALLTASLVSSTLTDQVQGFPWPWPNHPRTTTVIDLLSTNEEFGPLIRALQQTALIPILNASENITLIAPIADAINGFNGELTRELLMYHILKGSVLSSMVDDEIVVESILKIDPKDNTSLGIGVKIERQGDSGRGQGKLKIGGIARVVKCDWEANNGTFAFD